MDRISVEEAELLSFFEVEPQLSEAEIPWCYNDSSYRVELGAFSVQFSIAPAYKDLSCLITHNGEELYKFVALAVKDVRYHKRAEGEVLEVLVTERESILLQLRPRISISQTVAGAP